MEPPKPRVPLRNVGVTSIAETCTVSSEGVTPHSSLVRTHAPIPSPLLTFSRSLVRGVSAGCHQPLLLTGPSRRYFANPSSDACAPTTAGPPSALAWFFLGV